MVSVVGPPLAGDVELDVILVQWQVVTVGSDPVACCCDLPRSSTQDDGGALDDRLHDELMEAANEDLRQTEHKGNANAIDSIQN